MTRLALGAKWGAWKDAPDAPSAASCSETAGKAISCLGVSSISARQDDAEDEAADAALDAAANALAVRIADARWKQVVRSLQPTDAGD